MERPADFGNHHVRDLGCGSEDVRGLASLRFFALDEGRNSQNQEQDAGSVSLRHETYPSLRCLGFESRYPKGTRERCQPPHGGDPILCAGEAELPERPRYFPNYTRSGGSRQETVSRLRWESAADPFPSD